MHDPQNANKMKHDIGEPATLILLGMHRSGTSVATGLLGLCGAWVGDQQELTGAGKENPKGFFERRDIRNICDNLLLSTDADWWKVSDFHASMVPDEALAKLGPEFGHIVFGLKKHGTCVIKEPRLCLLFPILAEFVKFPVIVHTIRNPVEIAKSLRTRNNFAMSHGLALWESYTRRALAASAAFPRVFISYENLVSDPATETRLLLEKLQAQNVPGLAYSDAVAGFVSDGLHRETAASEEMNHALDEDQQSLWENLLYQRNLAEEAAKPLSERSLMHLRDLEQTHRCWLEAKSAYFQKKEEDKERLINITKKLDNSNYKINSLKENNRIQTERLINITKKLDNSNYKINSLKENNRIQIDKWKAKLEESEKRLFEKKKFQIHTEKKLSLIKEKQKVSQKKISILLTESAKQRNAMSKLQNKYNFVKKELVIVEKELFLKIRKINRIENRLRMSEFSKIWKPTSLLELLSKPFYNNRIKLAREKRLISASAIFDRTWYLEKYQDVAKSKLDPLDHYLRFGAAEGRDPGPNFSTEAYCEVHQDVKKAGLNPLVHYILHGQNENRVVYSAHEGHELYTTYRGRKLLRNERRFKNAPTSIDVTRSNAEVTFSKNSTRPTDKRIIVYTCLFGNYEALREPPAPDPRVKWIVFTDNPDLTSEIFDVVLITEALSSVRRTSRLPKILAHRYLPPHDISLYVDASLQVVGSDVVGFVEWALGDADAALFKHHELRSIFEEIQICRDLGIERQEICDRMVMLYSNAQGYKNIPIFENMLIIRQNNPTVQNCNEYWWNLYKEGAQRDQLSLALAQHTTGIQTAEIKLGEQVRFNSFVRWKKHQRDSLPAKRLRVFIFIAYAPTDYEQNLGKAYNDYMRRLGPDDWAVFIDHDAILRGRNTPRLLSEFALGYSGREILIVGSTNRINNPYQRIAQYENEHDLSTHNLVADALYDLNRDQLYDVTKLPSTSGFLMMLSKRTWEKHKFQDGFLGVDNAMHKSFRGGHGRVLFSKSLYTYHYYRADGDTTHAIKARPGEQQSNAITTNFNIERSRDSNEKSHFLRTFVFTEMQDLELRDYLSVLRPGEWAIFLSVNAIFVQKNWNRLLSTILRNTEKYTFVGLRDLEECNGRSDHLVARARAIDFEAEYGSRLTNSDLNLKDFKGFCISFELLKVLLSKENATIFASNLPKLASEAGANCTVADGVVIQSSVCDIGCEIFTSQAGQSIITELQQSRRIALITLGFWPQQAGMEMFFHNLATELTRAGDQIVLFAPLPKEPFDEIERNYIIRRFKDVAHFEKLFSEHQNGLPFDSILVQGAYSAANMALKVGQAHGIPVVLRTHGEDIQIDSETGYGLRLDPKKAEIIENNLRAVAHNVAISTHVGNEVSKIVNEKLVTVISNGVNAKHFQHQEADEIRLKFPQISKSTCILLTVGRNVKKKAFVLAIETLAELRKRNLDVCLVHVGKPGNGENLRKKAESLNVNDHFYELGEISYFDMPRIYSSADIFIFPSKMETFGNVTLEAMACGLPCVEFDYGANHDKIIDGVTGYIIPWGETKKFANAIETLINNSSIRDQLTRAALKAISENFDWPIIVKRYRAILHQAADKR